MASGVPMRRLLQGDVGSGKTVVAACCALFAIESGFEVALMAPTEVLADQHFATFRRWFEPLGIRVRVQTGSYKSGPAEALGQAGTADGKGPSGLPNPTGDGSTSGVGSMIVGTHALIADQFHPANLGLVIIDEQHRFGVAQREQLVRKGPYPHLLVMTATPIPRTLGLTVYGDLDISILDEMPHGRTPIKTFVRSRESLEKVWEFVRSQLVEGRQALPSIRVWKKRTRA
ncbi:MAG: DEAD/DEAH box helicase [Verrucomicrobiota bacterium]